MSKLRSFRDLRVYQKLKWLHLEAHRESMTFPKFEMSELGSQLRRSSSSAPAILAEGRGSRHTNIYIEAVNRAMGEVRETQHHLDVACEKGHFSAERFQQLDADYEHCGKMLERLHQALSDWRGTTRTGTEVSEAEAVYHTPHSDLGWDAVMNITDEVDAEFFPTT